MMPCLVRMRQPFCDPGSIIPFVLEIVFALLTRAKPINTLECYLSKEQEVKCDDFTFGLALPQLRLTERREC